MDTGPRAYDWNQSLTSQASIKVTPRSQQLGYLLCESGDVQYEQIAEALSIQKRKGIPLGQILLEMGACSAHAVARALRIQSGESSSAHAEPLSITSSASHVLTIIALATSDTICLAISATTAGLTHHFLRNSSGTDSFSLILSFFIIHSCLLLLHHLHLFIGVSPSEELRRIFLFVCLLYVSLLAGQVLNLPSTFTEIRVFTLSWLMSLILVPVGRGATRLVFANRPWWGCPIIIFGDGETARRIATSLLTNPGLCLKPIAIVRSQSLTHEGHSNKTNVIAPPQKSDFPIPIVTGLHLATVIAKANQISYAVVAMPGLTSVQLLNILERYVSAFKRLVIIPDVPGYGSLHAPARDLNGIIGLELRQQLLLKTPQTIKRALDIGLSIIFCFAFLPLMLLIALMIRLESPGAALYIQPRLGINGRRFNALKFRTMFGNGEERLKELLDSDPALRAEYQIYHKLKHDPRVTRLGHILRKFSLDELPQLINVIKGEMSLVGPRPYLEREIPDMKEHQALILKTRPGITGMWQVKSRNKCSFDERLAMDSYYVRNWSPWFDIYLLACTAKAVLKGEGS